MSLNITVEELAEEINAEILTGNPSTTITGWFSTLGAAQEGDVVVRWWLDHKGAEIAHEKGVACLVTEEPRGRILERCEELNIPLLRTEIDKANEYALRLAKKKYAPDATTSCVTGTNGKSTTNHLIAHILKKDGRDVYCNTDFRSEKNTLIDPVVAMEIRETKPKDNLAIEVSEVQGLPTGRVMEDHAKRMAKALECEIATITNVGTDHTNLVSGIDEMAEAIRGLVEALPPDGTAVLNADDPYVRGMTRNDVNTVWYGWNEGTAHVEKINDEEWIVLENEPLIPVTEFPLPVDHFIYNALAAVATTHVLNVEPDTIADALRTYRPLERRFEKLSDDPLIYDDFCHNPNGVLATVKALKRVPKDRVVIVFAVRGSRGVDINKEIARALAEGAEYLTSLGRDVHIIVTSSEGRVDETNVVKPEELKAFLHELEKADVPHEHHPKLEDALERALELADENTVILLGGAQGMEPAREILTEMGVLENG